MILAVAPEPPVDLGRMASKVQAKAPGQLQTVLLSDPDHAVINRYGLLNEKAVEKGLPHPATYVIDRQGVVRWKFVEVDYRVRPSNAMVRAALAAAN